ncbi:hypothetical protein [Williamsia sp. 1135]|uniref:hypothetical protein n=1 Tax=Williamsia sp. 1135 TaxID=1889262 RepID=UPI00117FCAE8|nr:hypothetical protein [Williamsia sp. 1135]
MPSHLDMAVQAVPMLDLALHDRPLPDISGSLRVAATWLWTRFDPLANAELTATLARRGLAPADTSDLKQVDVALRSASTSMFDELLAWCVAGACQRSASAHPPARDDYTLSA